MHRILERLDGAASTIVPLAYLAGMMLGTAAYFSGVIVDAGLAVGLALAVAVELHGFLEQRRVRALWTANSRASSDAERDAVRPQLAAHVAILAALVAFQAYNSYRFLALTGRPDLLRALVLPLAFLVSGALSPLTHDPADELRAASRSMLHYTVRKMARQWRKRVRHAAGPAWWQFWRRRSEAVDLSPIAIALMHDAGDAAGARRIQLIADGLSTAEGRPVTQVRAAAPASLEAPAEAFNVAWDRPPTGPGSPASKRGGSKRAKRQPARGAALRLMPPEDAETRIRAALAAEPGISIRALADAAGVSQATASKWRKVIRSESAATAGQMAR